MACGLEQDKGFGYVHVESFDGGRPDTGRRLIVTPDIMEALDHNHHIVVLALWIFGIILQYSTFEKVEFGCGFDGRVFQAGHQIGAQHLQAAIHGQLNQVQHQPGAQPLLAIFGQHDDAKAAHVL